TCTIVCQDEEAHMVPCLESVAWCDEIVVVDGGSRDRTAALARRLTDRVLTNPWPGYRAQKQFALDAARGEWVLNLDADERISPELADEVRAALVHVPAQVAGFAIPRLVCYLGRWWYTGDWYPRRVVRLVRRAGCARGSRDSSRPRPGRSTSSSAGPRCASGACARARLDPPRGRPYKRGRPCGTRSPSTSKSTSRRTPTRRSSTGPTGSASRG